VRRTLDVTSRAPALGLAIFIRGGGSDSALPAGGRCSVPSRAVWSRPRFVARVGDAELGGTGSTRGGL
jgi:hypothetical protein